MEDLTVKLGLMMEAAQAQQALVASALERLREHTSGLDGIVREEIRATLVEELQAVSGESRDAACALANLRRTVTVRSLLCGGVAAALSAALPLALAWWLLPSRAEIAALRTSRDELSANLAQLSAGGARAQLRRCGADRRLCVRIDRAAPAFGERADYRVIQGC